jgi:hypothetical protein
LRIVKGNLVNRKKQMLVTLGASLCLVNEADLVMWFLVVK